VCDRHQQADEMTRSCSQWVDRGRNGWKANTSNISASTYRCTMICNIIDSRKRPYRWKSVNAVIEATSHDNTVDDADERPEGPEDIVYEERKHVSVEEAVAWANSQPSAVTMFLYDEGDGIE
jgi:hypothetical protein